MKTISRSVSLNPAFKRFQRLPHLVADGAGRGARGGGGFSLSAQGKTPDATAGTEAPLSLAPTLYSKVLLE